MPRTGRAIDFVYRINLFEKPKVNLGGRQFTVQDSTVMGPHRADASALEISDAALSYALLTLGGFADESNSRLTLDKAANQEDEGPPTLSLGDEDKEAGSNIDHRIGGLTLRKGVNGDPTMVWMKVNAGRSSSSSDRKDVAEQERGMVVMKPLRPSFLRAALLATSTRQEAQLQVREENMHIWRTLACL